MAFLERRGNRLRVIFRHTGHRKGPHLEPVIADSLLRKVVKDGKVVRELPIAARPPSDTRCVC